MVILIFQIFYFTGDENLTNRNNVDQNMWIGYAVTVALVILIVQILDITGDEEFINKKCCGSKHLLRLFCHCFYGNPDLDQN